MQKILLHVVKASYALYTTGDMLLAEKGEGCKAILKLLIDSLALPGLSSIEINKEAVMGHRLLHHLKQLVKIVPAGLNQQTSKPSSRNKRCTSTATTPIFISVLKQPAILPHQQQMA